MAVDFLNANVQRKLIKVSTDNSVDGGTLLVTGAILQKTTPCRMSDKLTSKMKSETIVSRDEVKYNIIETGHSASVVLMTVD
jgi:hypothetical protein